MAAAVEATDTNRPTPLTLETLRDYQQRGLLKSQRHPQLPLTIWNYTPTCQYDRVWDEVTLQCRGLVIDDDDKVWARPFPKFFNYGEPDVILPDESFTVTEKMDGSLIIAFCWRSDDPSRSENVWASRGSFVSEHARAAARISQNFPLEPGSLWTMLFELIHPDFRIIVDYGSRAELVHLATIDTASGKPVDFVPAGYAHVAEHQGLTWNDMALPRSNSEGYVVTFQSGYRVKVKHEEYMRMARVLARISDKAIWDMLRNGESLEPIIEVLPDEYHPRIKATVESLTARHDALMAEAQRGYEVTKSMDRKAAALYLADHCPRNLHSAVYRLLDGKEPSEYLWKLLKPESSEPWWNVAA